MIVHYKIKKDHLEPTPYVFDFIGYDDKNVITKNNVLNFYHLSSYSLYEIENVFGVLYV